MDIKELLAEYERINAELNHQIKENGEEVVKEVFKSIFDEHEGLNVVGIVGWTPEFNDGEPCEHTQSTFVGRTWGSANYIDFEDEPGNFEEDFELQENGTHLNSNCTTLDKAFEQIKAYEELIQRVYYTDFRLVIKREEGGGVVIHSEEYDCGY